MEATIGNALPESCFLPGEVMVMLKASFLPELRRVMTDDEIIAGSKGNQPALDKMRQITCRRCNERRCPLNFRFEPRDFKGLIESRNEERIRRAKEIMIDILPEDIREMLKEQGIGCHIDQMPSGRTPQIWFAFKKGDKWQRVNVQYITGTLLVEGKSERLISLEQVRHRVKEAYQALSTL